MHKTSHTAKTTKIAKTVTTVARTVATTDVYTCAPPEPVCGTHAEHPARFACMYSHCGGPVLNCVVCSQTQHRACNGANMVPVAELQKHLAKSSLQAKQKKRVEELEQFMESKISTLVGKFTDMKRALMESVDAEAEQQQHAVLDEFIRSHRGQHGEHGEEADEQVIEAEARRDSGAIEQKYALIQEMVSAEIGGVYNSFRKLGLPINNTGGDEGKWVGHADMRVFERDAGTFVLLLQGSGGVFICAYSQPMWHGCTFRLSIRTIDSRCRFADMGIADSSIFSRVRDAHGFAKCRKQVSFCGYKCVGGLRGKMPTARSYDSRGHAPQKSVTMQYVPGERIRFHNEEGTLDVSKDLSDDNTAYYVYVAVSSKETSFWLSRLQ